MGMGFDEGGTILRILYTTLGRRVTRVLVWVIAIAALIAVSRWVLENIEWYASRYDWGSFANLNWANALYTFLMVVIVSLFMVSIAAAVGALIGYILRVGLATPMQRRVDKALQRTTELLRDVSKYTSRSEDIITVNKLLYETEELYSEWHDSKMMKIIRWPERKPKKE